MLMGYLNGDVPYSVVSVVLASGYDENGYWEFRCTPTFAACWAAAKRYAEAHFGRTIYIRTGWNIYRPYAVQVTARQNAAAAGNPLGAAYPRTSSHGGNWNGRDCLAVDVDPNGLSWDQVDEAMESAGFAARLITEAMSGIAGGERWHYILFIAFDPIPAWLGSTPFTPAPPLEDDDMLALIINAGGVKHLTALGPGIFRHFVGSDNPDRIKNIMRAQDDWQEIDISELPAYLRTYGCDLNIWDFRDDNGNSTSDPAKFCVLDPLNGNVVPGAMWSAAGAIRAAIANIVPPQVDMPAIVLAVRDAVAAAVKANPQQVDVDETAIAREVLAGLPKAATADQIAAATAGVLAAKLGK